MELNNRQKDIMDLLYAKGRISVSELSRQLFVSEMTIRRDLSAMETDGLLKRYRGGAVPLSIDSEMPISRRFYVDESEKIALSKKAALYLHDHMVVFIDSSSTCHYIIPHIRRFHNMTIVTNSVNALRLAAKSHIPCILIGGHYHEKDMCFTGPIAEMSARQFNVDISFFSSLGLSEDGTISDSDIAQSSIRKIIIEHSAKSIFLFEQSKMNQKYVYTVSHRTEIDDIITL